MQDPELLAMVLALQNDSAVLGPSSNRS